MLKGDKIFYSFFETEKPTQKVFKKGLDVDLGINLLPISVHENILIEWWESDSSRSINKKILEQLNLIRKQPNFKPTLNMASGSYVYRVS